MPVNKFIAATNANDVIPKFIESGEMNLKPSVATLSNAMDVGNPSNFVRILEIFQQNFPALKEKVKAISVSDKTTAKTMREVFEKYNYVLDPHGAVGFHIDEGEQQRVQLLHGSDYLGAAPARTCQPEAG